MTPTEQLKEEHQGILLMLKILEKVCDRLDSKEKAKEDHLERVVEFFRIFVDKCHHGKEEDLLFPEMETSGIPKERGPIGAMLLEHEQGRTYVRGMGDAVVKFKKGEATASVEFTKNARRYIPLLSDHIDKENNILFPMGEKAISRKKQEELLEAFEELERERIGVGTHEAFHKLLHQLQEFYLK
ncbi:MAG: hemerythrin domain-containing protein [Thermodesulfobacteriota bacterium]